MKITTLFSNFKFHKKCILFCEIANLKKVVTFFVKKAASSEIVNVQDQDFLFSKIFVVQSQHLVIKITTFRRSPLFVVKSHFQNSDILM